MKPLHSNLTRIAFCRKMHFCMPNRSSQAIFHSIEIVMFPLSICSRVCFWSSKEPSHLIGPFKYPQHIIWLRNNKNSFPLRALIWRTGMGSRLTVRQYNNTLSNAFKSMGSHLRTNIFFLGTFFLCKYYEVHKLSILLIFAPAGMD